MAEANNTQSIILDIKEQEVKFNVNREAYNAFVNGTAKGGNLTKTATNFLTTTVDAEHQDFLVQFIKDTPSSEMFICGLIIEDYSPDLEDIVKKRKK